MRRGNLWCKARLPRRPQACRKQRYRSEIEAQQHIDRMEELAQMPAGPSRVLAKPGRWKIYECEHCGPGVFHVGHSSFGVPKDERFVTGLSYAPGVGR